MTRYGSDYKDPFLHRKLPEIEKHPLRFRLPYESFITSKHGDDWNNFFRHAKLHMHDCCEKYAIALHLLMGISLLVIFSSSFKVVVRSRIYILIVTAIFLTGIGILCKTLLNDQQFNREWNSQVLDASLENYGQDDRMETLKLDSYSHMKIQTYLDVVENVWEKLPEFLSTYISGEAEKEYLKKIDDLGLTGVSKISNTLKQMKGDEKAIKKEMEKSEKKLIEEVKKALLTYVLNEIMLNDWFEPGLRYKIINMEPKYPMLFNHIDRFAKDWSKLIQNLRDDAFQGHPIIEATPEMRKLEKNIFKKLDPTNRIESIPDMSANMTQKVKMFLNNKQQDFENIKHEINKAIKDDAVFIATLINALPLDEIDNPEQAMLKEAEKQLKTATNLVAQTVSKLLGNLIKVAKILLNKESKQEILDVMKDCVNDLLPFMQELYNACQIDEEDKIYPGKVVREGINAISTVEIGFPIIVDTGLIDGVPGKSYEMVKMPIGSGRIVVLENGSGVTLLWLGLGFWLFGLRIVICFHFRERNITAKLAKEEEEATSNEELPLNAEKPERTSPKLKKKKKIVKYSQK